MLGKRKDVHFLVIGFPGEHHYEERMRREGLGNYFTFAGKIRYEDIGSFLSLADAAISPKVSKTESNSKLYHFMAQGIPSIVYDLPVNRRILGDSGIYVNPGNIAGLSREAERILGDADKRKELSLKLKERARTFNDWMKIGKQIEKIYYKLLV